MLNTVEVDGQRLFVVVSHDISERLRNEAQTRDQEATAKAIVDTVVDAIVTIDENDIVETYNQAAETTFGFTANEVIGNKVTMLMPSSRATQHEGLLAAFRNAGTDAVAGSSRPGTGQDKNGRIFPIELSVTEVQLNDRNIMACILRDISDRVKVGQEILDRETRIKAILDNAVDGIITINNQGLIETCNFSTEKIFGFTSDEMIGTNFEILLPEPYAALYSGYLSHYQLTGELRALGTNIEISGRRKDDSTFPMELSVTEAKLADRSVYIGIVRDISEQKLTQSNLLQAKEEAERANHAKSEFLSRMSHELRTPLNAILGFGQILDIKKLSPEGDDSVQHILQAGWHLTKLIDEVMDIAHIESGRQNISLEPLHVHELLKSSANLMGPLAVVRKIEIITPMPTECNKYVIADRQRLKQVLLNIIANAVKYNHDSGTVELYCNEIPEGILRISVRDTGPGIAPQDFDKAFEPFERLSAENGPIEGSGVGLAVSKTLVKAMGGTLGLDSQLGEGSTFWIEFPLIDYTTELAQPEEHKIEEHGAEQIAPATVLYIEDNTANFHLVEVALSLRPQIKLIEAMQGEIGIELARHHKPDLILLDLHLPVLMGDEVLARLKSYPETQKIPVIIVSANATKGQIERLLASGAYAYLTKPLNIKELLHTIDTVLADSDRKGGGSETP